MTTNEDNTFGVQPARWFLGPPAPRGTAFLARACSLSIIVLVGHWVRVHLGGVGFQPVPVAVGADELPKNDTGKLFNWHPVLMTLGFVVLMAEAILSYQAPILPGVAREVRKRIHLGCHLAACLCIALGLVAVLQSHRLSRPVPMPDWYSPHSYLGLTAMTLVGLQILAALCFYVWPRLSLSHRLALGPVHRFWGMAAWLAGLGAVATGLQEKVTFLQMKKLTSDQVHSPIVRLPAVVLPLLVVLAALVLYHQVPPLPVTEGSGGPGSGGNVYSMTSSTQGLLRGGRLPLDNEESEDEEVLAHRRV